MSLDTAAITARRDLLNAHPLLTGNALRTTENVRTFMEHHVYAVWDFMCLIKTLQHAIVPSTTIWTPQQHTNIGRFINEVILDEETDIGPSGVPVSHYELYTKAMKEIGADTSSVETFIRGLQTRGDHVLCDLLLSIPPAAETFCRTTLDVIGTRKIHCIAASFAFGRETTLPVMFTKIVQQLRDNNVHAPSLEYYLLRHITVDGDDHGPISLDMVNQLCNNDPVKYAEATRAAVTAIDNRYAFWSSIYQQLEHK